MNARLNPAISNGRAWLSLFILAVTIALPTFFVGYVTWNFSGDSSRMFWSAVSWYVLLAIVFALVYLLLFRNGTVGRIFFFGTGMVVYAVLSDFALQFWVNEFTKVLLKTGTHTWVQDVFLVLKTAQNLGSFFFAALGAGLVAAAIFQARVTSGAKDARSGEVAYLP